jgi:hypothetical protein
MRLRVCLALVLLLTLVWVIVLVPARVLGSIADDRALQFGAFSGSLWRGQSDRVLIQTQGLQFDVGQLRWRVNATSLLSGRLCVQATAVRHGAGSADQQRIEGNFCADTQRRLHLRDVSIRIPAHVLLRAESLRLRGFVDAHIQQALLHADGRWLDANVQGLWEDAALVVNMGSHWAVLSAGNLPFNARALTDGSLQVQMDNTNARRAGDTTFVLATTIRATQLMSLEGQVRPGAELDDELLAWLAVIAEPGDSGEYRYFWRSASVSH